jgi:transglutaminase-like putative cysteine protease
LNKYTTCATVALLFLSASFSYPLDPFKYSVEVKNFREQIARERSSRFRLSSSDEDFSLPATPYQKIIRQYVRDGIKTIEVRTGEVQPATQEKGPLAEYLVNTRFLNLDSPEITQTLRHFQHSPDIPASVEDYVHAHISDKGLGIPIVSAVQILKNRQGDCTEHSVLAVALLRAMKVPSRAVVGMYLTDSFMDKKNAFVYHMWIEAYHLGGWRLVDATMPGEKHPNRYIAFTYHSLKTEAPLPYLRAVMGIQNLTAEYIGE